MSSVTTSARRAAGAIGNLCTIGAPRLPGTVRIGAWLGFAAVLAGGPAHAQSFRCTEIVGFSQTLQWYETNGFQAEVPDARYQLRFRSGGDLADWANPGFDGWRAPTRAECVGSGPSVLCSPCSTFSTAPDRVILTITLSRYEDGVADWVSGLRAAVATIRRRHPQVERIVLQPVVGGPNDGRCPTPADPQRGVRAAYNHPRIDEAIAIVERDAPDLEAGPSPEVRTCGDYEDQVGHLRAAARSPIGAAIGRAYADGPAPTTSTTLAPGPSPTTTLGGGLPDGSPCTEHDQCRSGRCAFWRTPLRCIAP
jgi:hypothetical protein